MLDLALRPIKDRWLTPVADRVAGTVRADAITAIGLVAGLAAAGAAATGWRWASVVLWLAGRTVDGLDGLVARRRGEASDLGGYLDMLADTIAYAAIPIGLAWAAGGAGAWAATAVLLGAFYLNTVSWAYLSALLEKRGDGVAAAGEATSIRMPPALVEGTETIVCYTVFLALPRHLVVLFPVMAALVVVGVGQRWRWARRALLLPPAAPSRPRHDAKPLIMEER
ncbi:MAG: CDP-alcohol phosphatidyltransferase family protein [Acidimicrobiia bacterium]